MAILFAFFWGMRREYYGRPRNLWLNYLQYLPTLDPDCLKIDLYTVNATIGTIGYCDDLGIPNARHIRGSFSLWVKIGFGIEALHLFIEEPLSLQQLPGLSIPWHRISGADFMENEWGTKGFGFYIKDMPEDLDRNHCGRFLVWFYGDNNQLSVLNQSISDHLSPGPKSPAA